MAEKQATRPAAVSDVQKARKPRAKKDPDAPTGFSIRFPNAEASEIESYLEANDKLPKNTVREIVREFALKAALHAIKEEGLDKIIQRGLFGG